MICCFWSGTKTTSSPNILSVVGITTILGFVCVESTNSLTFFLKKNRNPSSTGNVHIIQSGATLSGGIGGSLEYVDVYNTSDAQCGHDGYGSSYTSYIDLCAQNG